MSGASPPAPGPAPQTGLDLSLAILAAAGDRVRCVDALQSLLTQYGPQVFLLVLVDTLGMLARAVAIGEAEIARLRAAVAATPPPGAPPAWKDRAPQRRPPGAGT